MQTLCNWNIFQLTTGMFGCNSKVPCSIVTLEKESERSVINVARIYWNWRSIGKDKVNIVMFVVDSYVVQLFD